jgi:parallel beta-helix repeat protein
VEDASRHLIWLNDGLGHFKSITSFYGPIIHVPGDRPTIQAGIDVAADGDTVLIADGTYTRAGNFNLNFNGKAITVKSVNGAAATIIDCENRASTRGVLFQNGETDTSVLDGLTIRNGNKDSGGGIRIIDASPTIANCIITGNNADWGGGIHISASSAPTIINCIITKNKANWGGAIRCDNEDCSPAIINCTITENAGGGIACFYFASLSIKNSILWGNNANGGYEVFTGGDSLPITITFSDVDGGQAGIGGAGAVIYESNISADPLFVDPANEDYHLSPRSPCLDAGATDGAPDTDIEGNPRPLGKGVDMGAYEQDESSPWDVNADGEVNVLDIILVAQHFEEEVATSSYPNPDVNGDGIVNILDIILVAQHFGEAYSQAAPSKDVWKVDQEHLPLFIRIYNIMEKNPSSDPDFLTAKSLLQRLISNTRVTKTEAFQNYPNPFNPDTWIPYQLQEDSDVVIKIYTSTGRLVQTLSLGHKPAGVYSTKDKAAYWDGRNEEGEKTASGIYFYNIQAGDFTATKKMTIVE